MMAASARFSAKNSFYSTGDPRGNLGYDGASPLLPLLNATPCGYDAMPELVRLYSAPLATYTPRHQFVSAGSHRAHPLAGAGMRGTSIHDSETGIDYFGARYFSGEQGRFTSPDTPLVGQNPSNPQSWNLYSYGLNNPLGYNDPTGHDSEEPDPGDPDKAPCGVNMKDCGPAIATGVYGSADGRWSLFPTRLKLAREGADKTLGPEFDTITLGPVLGKVLQLALGAAAKRLGLEVAADLGIAVNRAGIGEALADEARVLHAGRHSCGGGLG
jgi:RHS repeat-associated protein